MFLSLVKAGLMGLFKDAAVCLSSFTKRKDISIIYKPLGEDSSPSK